MKELKAFVKDGEVLAHNSSARKEGLLQKQAIFHDI